MIFEAKYIVREILTRELVVLLTLQFEHRTTAVEFLTIFEAECLAGLVLMRGPMALVTLTFEQIAVDFLTQLEAIYSCGARSYERGPV